MKTIMKMNLTFIKHWFIEAYCYIRKSRQKFIESRQKIRPYFVYIYKNAPPIDKTIHFFTLFLSKSNFFAFKTKSNFFSNFFRL